MAIQAPAFAVTGEGGEEYGNSRYSHGRRVVVVAAARGGSLRKEEDEEAPPGGRGLSLTLRLPPTPSFPFCRRADGVEANARRRQSKLSTSLSPRGRGGNVKANARRSFSHGCLRDHRADEAGARGRGGRAGGAGHSPEV